MDDTTHIQPYWWLFIVNSRFYIYFYYIIFAVLIYFIIYVILWTLFSFIDVQPYRDILQSSIQATNIFTHKFVIILFSDTFISWKEIKIFYSNSICSGVFAVLVPLEPPFFPFYLLNSTNHLLQGHVIISLTRRWVWNMSVRDHMATSEQRCVLFWL